jgi:hypothetical protein
MTIRVQKGTSGKLIVQDWSVLESYDEDFVLRLLTRRQIAALLAITEFLHWETRYKNSPGLDEIDNFASKTEYRLMEDVEICALIIACITGDTDVKAAFRSWLINEINTSTSVQQALAQQFDPSKPGSNVPGWYRDQNATGGNTECDLDMAWGNIREGLVNRSFQRVIDVLENIEFMTDNQEMLASLLNAIPFVGALFDVVPATDWVLWFDNVRAWMRDAFESGDTTELRDQIACDLFCIWQIDCSLSIRQIADYYQNKTLELVPSWSNAWESMNTLLGALAGSNTSFGSAIVYALVGTQYGFQTFINSWFGITIECVFGDLGLGEPSDDHLLLCEDCPPVCVEPAWRAATTDYGCGTVDQTDNLDGTWTVVFTSEFTPSANRILQVEANQCCWNVISVVYSMSPENLSNHYLCGANPPPEDVGQDSEVGPIPVDSCTAGMLASSISSAFTVTLLLEACP